MSHATFIDKYKAAQEAAGIPSDTDHADLTGIVFVASTLMTGASMAMNVTFAFLIVTSVWAKVLLAVAYFSSDVFKVAAPSLARFFWLRGNPFFSAVIVFGLVLTVALSWVSGTGFLSETTAETQAKQLHDSPEFQNNQNNQARLSEEAAALAVSPAALAAAHRELERLQAEWEKAYATNSRYFERDYSPKYVNRLKLDTWHDKTEQVVQHVMRPIDDKMAAQRRIIERGELYQAKVSELQRIQQEAPTNESSAAVLPVFQSLSEWFDSIPAKVKVQVFVMTSITLELVAGIGWLCWGMMRKPRTLTADELARANYEQQAQMMMMKQALDEMSGSFGNVIEISPTPAKNDLTESPTTHETKGSNADAFSNNFSVAESNTGEAIQAAATGESTTDNASEQVEVLPIPESGKRRTGGVYPCIHCNAPYEARTTWHKYCPECRKHNVKDSIARGKS